MTTERLFVSSADDSTVRRVVDNIMAAIGTLLIGIAILVAGCRKQEYSEMRGNQAVSVQTALVANQTISEKLTRVGSIRSREIVEISPETAGTIKQVHFTEGDAVDANDLLFSLDDRKLQKQLNARKAGLEAAQARADFARVMYERYEDLLELDAAAASQRDKRKSELDAARAEIERLDAEIALLRERLRDTRVRAPMRGTVGERNVDKGDFVNAGRHLTTLHSVEREVRFSVPEAYVGRVHKGQQVELHVGAFPNETFDAEVIFVSPSVDTYTRTLVVKAQIGDASERLKSGMFATAELILDTHENVPVVPEEALVATQEGYVVYVVSDGKARRQAVTVGIRRPGKAEVKTGLRRGQRIVTAGQMRVKDGSEVRVGNADESASTGDPSATSSQAASKEQASGRQGE